MSDIFKNKIKYSELKEKFIKEVARRTQNNYPDVHKLLKINNIITIDALSRLLKCSPQNITNLLSEKLVDGKAKSKLNYCYPFSLGFHKGKRFIIIDDNLISYISERLGIK